MTGRRRLVATAAILVALPATGYVIDDWWDDAANIVMDDVLIPADTWSLPAQYQMTEWNEVDTTDNSHPFRIAGNPQQSFGADDGQNTIGFLGESGLNSEYGLSWAGALAWTVCWGSPIDECDVMIDPSRPWALGPDDDEWFQSAVLHELGHVRGLDHYNNWLSMQNSGANNRLRGERLYMDDKEAVRQHASHPLEADLTMYRKYHDGNAPHWMTMGPTTVRVGQTVSFQNISVENRGTQAFGTLRFGIYLSTDDLISTGDRLLNTGTFTSFGRFVKSTFNWSAAIPVDLDDCATRYVGGIIDDDDAYGERFEGNNDVAFSNGTFDPTPLTILLQEDFAEPNDSAAAAYLIGMGFFSSALSIDQDFENDYFRFQLTELASVRVDVTFDHASGDIDLELYNAEGSILAQSSGIGDSESVALSALQPGDYFVRVSGFGEGSCNRYTLAVDRIVRPAGEAPDLQIARAGGDLQLSWDPSCSPGDGDYAVYEGALGSFSSHIVRTCSTGEARNYLLEPGAGNRYYLVVPTDRFVDGSYGRDSTGSERPAAAMPCGAPVASPVCRACDHDKCTIGAALEETCEECVAAICAVDSFCCTITWDQLCVNHVRTACSNYGCAVSEGLCPHGVCEVGDPLFDGCDEPPIVPSCVTQICATDSFCCTTAWDALCVSEVASVCGGSCI